MKTPVPSPAASLRPLRPLEHRLIQARMVNASATHATGVVMGNRAFLRVWAARRARPAGGTAST